MPSPWVNDLKDISLNRLISYRRVNKEHEMLKLKIHNRLAPAQCHEAAELYAAAFESKCSYFFGSKADIVSLFPAMVNSDQVLALIMNDNELIGITGFSLLKSPMLQVKLSVMLQKYGYLNGLLRYCRWRLFFYRSFPDKHLYIDAVAIKEGHRGKGYVRLLLNAAEKIALQKGMTYLELDVADDNEPAFQAYKKEGFTKVKVTEIPNYYAKIFHVAKVTTMVKILEQNWFKTKS